MGPPASLSSPNVGDWVRLKQPFLLGESKRYYGQVCKIVAEVAILAFPIRKTYASALRDPGSYETTSYDISEFTTVDQASGPVRIGGSGGCESGSLQTGGNHAYCTCNGCF